MNKIIEYIFNMLPYMSIAIPIVLIGTFIKYKKNKKINWSHEILLLIFIAFLIGLASQAILPKDFNQGYSLKNITIEKINIIPFKIVFETYYEVVKNQNINYFLINFLGNIIMFMPIGFLVSILWKTSTKKAVLIGFACSLCIEIIQLFINRGTDIDDLILNTFGTFCGVVMYKLICRKM